VTATVEAVVRPPRSDTFMQWVPGFSVTVSYLPVRRAATVEPVEALRVE